ncbi:cobaltochelatase subunit CobN, partial [Rhizobiaceae bacterium]|nr:cobaltochelatase subunit CobN [Rhizobiaceae bacterium]
MHLLVAQKGALADSDEAVDLGQSPADVIVVSAADTELASLAAARSALPDPPSLRLVNLMGLAHPMSIDVWCERTVAKSKLVVVRCLGGESYWPYGLERLHATALEHGVALCVLPGDDKPDPSLARFDTVTRDEGLRLWSYLAEGGAANAAAFLRVAKGLVDGVENDAPAAAPLPKAGVWPDLASALASWTDSRPVVAVTFYRALVQAGNTQPVDALCGALRQAGCNPLPIYVSSLKEPLSQDLVRGLFGRHDPSVVINLTGFAVGGYEGTVLDETGAVVLQAVLSGGGEEQWRGSSQGLSSRDLAMNVALPEVDGRVLSRAIAFKDASRWDEACQANIVRHEAVADRVDFAAELAANWARLRGKPPAERRVALVLANYPNRDGRLGNGVGLDTPAGTIEVLRAMADSGYAVTDIPPDGNALIDALMAGPTNAARDGRVVRETLSLTQYNAFFAELPVQIQDEVQERWGAPDADPFFEAERSAFALPLMRLGQTMLGIQPARGYNIDPSETYHSPDLVPPHGYFAFYACLREAFGADAIVHMGKHGNLEWLPGKALALSAECYPEAVFGPTPQVYPFIVNDPGEGSQAKRRTSAVIVDHLTPPLTRAETYGPLKELEALVDEYYEASGLDPRRLDHLRREIVALMAATGLDKDMGVAGQDGDEALQRLDAYLCELKEMQIRDGLHVFGVSPMERLRRDLLVALLRVPRSLGEGADASLHRAIAADLGLDGFDPLDCDMGAPWQGERPSALDLSNDPWRTTGDTVERIEALANALVEGTAAPGPASATVMEALTDTLAPAVDGCGPAEIAGLLRALEGRFLAPGPSGAPTRGRLDVLPTGRNFYSVDSRSVPTPAAWHLGQASAELLVMRHRQEEGEHLRAVGLSAWGTSNMRTGGDDIAQAMALMGVKPTWDHGSRRVTGYEIITLAELGRPRVDVTLRIS